jgi:hypothetical protein
VTETPTFEDWTRCITDIRVAMAAASISPEPRKSGLQVQRNMSLRQIFFQPDANQTPETSTSRDFAQMDPVLVSVCKHLCRECAALADVECRVFRLVASLLLRAATSKREVCSTSTHAVYK